VFTHSAKYHPAPLRYPITELGFDDLAWNTPWFLLLNYAVLGVVGVWLLRSARNQLGR